MPKNDMWPYGIESTGEMDSAESLNSLNSCSSDDSLEHLSAEEKACLLFLEETIEALDTEDDSGLSVDEDESLPAPGNVANKAAYLSASIERRKGKDLPKHYVDDGMMFGSTEQSQILNYLVPTPFILATGNGPILPKPGSFAAEVNPPAKENIALTSEKLSLNGPRVPSEVNVIVIPPPYTTKNNNVRGRGPLSYEGLLELRNNVSTRKNGETRNLYDNIGQEKTEVLYQNFPSRDSWGSKPNPPTVAPKPKTIPSHILHHKETTSSNTDSNIHSLSTSPRSKGFMKPEKVRIEALSKLGLLKGKKFDLKSSSKQGYYTETPTYRPIDPVPDSVPQLSQSMPLPSSPLTQDSTALHHRSMTDLTTGPSQPQHWAGKGKSITLERSAMGLENGMSNTKISTKERSDNLQTHSSTLQSSGKPQAPSRSSAAAPQPHKPSRAPGFKVLMVPNMGDDRREALRKLGLLKI